jgi:DNA-binding CsgD family transcriptional regulator
MISALTTKPVSSDELLQAVERAIAHQETTRDLKGKLDTIRAHIAALTPRERQVFKLVVRGKQNKQITDALGGTVRTIKAHRHKVMEKMQVHSVAELVSLAERVGVIRQRVRQPTDPLANSQQFSSCYCPTGQQEMRYAKPIDWDVEACPLCVTQVFSKPFLVHSQRALPIGQGHQLCQIETSSLSSMTTPACL